MDGALWMVAGTTLMAVATVLGTDQGNPDQNEPEEYIKVEVKGRLRHGIVAIGGETTGTVITAKGVTWELDLRKNPECRNKAEQLNGQKVVVTGSLDVRAGVEIPRRWIVTVTSLKAAGAKGNGPERR